MFTYYYSRNYLQLDLEKFFFSVGRQLEEQISRGTSLTHILHFHINNYTPIRELLMYTM